MFRDPCCAVIALVLVGCAETQSKAPAPDPPPAPAPEPAVSVAPDTTVKVDAAKTATEPWLALVDQEKYPESWDLAAKAFQRAVTRENWTSSVAAARSPFGKFVSRRLRSAKYATSLPGAPDGQYVVIQFDASFEKKAQAVETVTPMLEDDGSWKVSGYFIR
jgi:hypothetical protein